MALQSITNINIDFCDKKYILINAKQFDKGSRFLSVTCYNHGELFHINASEHSAYIRYRKPDENSVFNACEINHKGKVVVELTEQMLVSEGISYADLLIVSKGNAEVNTETGEIVAINGSGILSTMTFCIDVSESIIDNSTIESSYEYDVLNKIIEKAEAEYQEVILTAKSYAVGDAGGIRQNEDTDNAKYYCQTSVNSSNSAKISETNAKTYAENAKASEIRAETSKNTIQSLFDNFNSDNNVFIPMGTVSFSELGNANKVAGVMYNISDSFVTDNTFEEGAGHFYNAGVNVYYTSNGLWDCFGGESNPIATVDEVIEYLNISV